MNTHTHYIVAKGRRKTFVDFTTACNFSESNSTLLTPKTNIFSELNPYYGTLLQGLDYYALL